MVNSYITILPNETIMKITFPKIIHHLAFVNGQYYSHEKKNLLNDFLNLKTLNVTWKFVLDTCS